MEEGFKDQNGLNLNFRKNNKSYRKQLNEKL